MIPLPRFTTPRRLGIFSTVGLLLCFMVNTTPSTRAVDVGSDYALGV
jgi:hypothetical protein